ncbi:MAG: hypothetical protein ACE5IZ_01160 [Dehalococcoidia bacterium]
MTNTVVTLPPISPQLQTAIRQLGLRIGWKNVARRLAFGPTTETAKRERTEREQERRLYAQERQEALLYLAHDNPVLDFCGYRKVSRYRVPTGNGYGPRERPRPRMVEQVTVTPRLYEQLKERGVKVEHNRRTDTYWADVEDEVWGADDWFTLAFPDGDGGSKRDWNDALHLLRKADEARRFLRQGRTQAL